MRTSAVPNLVVQIIEVVEAAWPGWVKTEFHDANGVRHVIQDKVPIFCSSEVEDLRLPHPGEARCEIVKRWRDEQGRDLVQITAMGPDDLDSIECLSEFVVLSNQLVS
jgi:hypothetical protein